MRAGLRLPWVREITALHSSTEQKAIDGAAIWAERLGIGYACHDDLGENDRTIAARQASCRRMNSSASLTPSSPTQPSRCAGWERAVDAQQRVVAAVERIARTQAGDGVIAIVGHGAVGTLLHCHLAGTRSRGSGTIRPTVAATGMPSQSIRLPR